MEQTQIIELAHALIEAAQDFEREDFGAQFYDDDEAQMPRALYVQRDTRGAWSAAFRPAEDMDAEMTRWATGDDAVGAYRASLAGTPDAAAIARLWDSDWDA